MSQMPGTPPWNMAQGAKVSDEMSSFASTLELILREQHRWGQVQITVALSAASLAARARHTARSARGSVARD